VYVVSKISTGISDDQLVKFPHGIR
jgi:hypothetical protein